MWPTVFRFDVVQLARSRRAVWEDGPGWNALRPRAVDKRVAGNRRTRGGISARHGGFRRVVDSVVERGPGCGPAAREGSGGVKRYELRFGLLGPPVVFEGSSSDAQGPDRAVRTISSPKVRTLFATLLLERGRVVSVESLTDALWGGAPPPSARASLHNHVARLRRLLDDPERLRAVPPGYLLRVDEGELDVDLFVSHVAAARAAHAERDWERTVRGCTEALALWRGTPLAGLSAEVGGYALVQRLTEARLMLLEWRYDAELTAAGPRLGALVPELAALAAEHPLREAFHRHLMLALHHTGRRAEALAVHRDLRTRLIEELGVEPGAGVREAHMEVLRGSGDGGAGSGLRGASEGSAGRGEDAARGAFGVAASHADEVLPDSANPAAPHVADVPLRSGHAHAVPEADIRETAARAEEPLRNTGAPDTPARPEADPAPTPPQDTPPRPPRPAQLPRLPPTSPVAPPPSATCATPSSLSGSPLSRSP